jgi:hypothetical protein
MSGYVLPYSRRCESLLLPIEFIGSCPLDFDASTRRLREIDNDDPTLEETDEDGIDTRAGWSAERHDQTESVET